MSDTTATVPTVTTTTGPVTTTGATVVATTAPMAATTAVPETTTTAPVTTTALPGDQAVAAQPEPVAAPQIPGWSDLTAAAIKDEKLRALAQRHLSLEDLVRNTADMLVKVRDPKLWVRLPGDNPQPEEIAAFRRNLGIPDAPESYGLTPPDGIDAEDFGAVLRTAHEHHVSKPAMAAIVESYLTAQAKSGQLQQQALADELRNAEADLRKEWGADYPIVSQLAARAIAWAGGSAVTETARKYQLDLADPVQAARALFLGDVGGLLRAFATMGKRMAPEVPQIAEPLAVVQSDYDALLKEFNDRMAKGTENDKEFQDRWGEANRRRWATAA